MSRVVLHGSTVITCNAAGQVGEAVCFDEAEGQIIAVGTQAQVQAAAGDGAPRSTSRVRRCCPA